MNQTICLVIPSVFSDKRNLLISLRHITLKSRFLVAQAVRNGITLELIDRPTAVVRLVLPQLGLLNIHVFEFAGFEDFAALKAFDELGVFFTGYDADTRVLALLHVDSLFCRLGRAGCSHRFRSGHSGLTRPKERRTGIGRIFSRKIVVVKQRMNTAVSSSRQYCCAGLCHRNSWFFGIRGPFCSFSPADACKISVREQSCRPRI